jgi:cytochrome c oxidase assembly factor CtaG
VKILSTGLGIATLGMVIASPAAHLDHHLLTAHMVKHLLLMLVAAPSILFGTRSIDWPRGYRPPALLARLRDIATHPAFCWMAGTVTVIVWHVPAVFELALHSNFWHEFEDASFFVAGLLFWLPVMRPRSAAGWQVPVYLFLATLPCDALSAYLAFCGRVVYEHYSAGAGHYGLAPLEDQALAGALMWVTVTFAYLIPALVVTAKLLSDERNRPSEFAF